MIKKLLLLLLKPTKLIMVIYCRIKSYLISRKIDEGNGRIILGYPPLNIKISKGKNAKFIVNGNCRIVPHLGGTAPVRIIIGNNATLHIDGDFVIGHGVRIHVGNNATLFFGGKDLESDSGITADTLIMTNKKIHIGKDFICAWNVFISDSDWHQISGVKHQNDVVIGNHVWIANSCSILKGSIIGENSIIASHSKTSNKSYPANSLLAGTPAQPVKTGIDWKRDL